MLRRLLILFLVILLLPLSGCTEKKTDDAEAEGAASSTTTPTVTASVAPAGGGMGRPVKVELHQDRATGSTAWVARVFATTDDLPVDDYRILVTTPEGTIRVAPERAALRGGSLVWTADMDGLADGTIDARPLNGDEDPARPLFRLEHRDAASDALMSARDLWTLRYAAGHDVRTLPLGAYTLTLVHVDTDIVAGTLATTVAQ